MRLLHWVVLTALLIPAVGWAGDEKVRDADAEKAAKAAFEALEAEFGQALKAWQEEAKKASEAGKAIAYEDSPVNDFVPKFEKGAKEYAKTDGAVRFLFWVVRNSFRDQAAAKASMETIVSEHASSPLMGELHIPQLIGYMGRVLGDDGVKAALTRIIDKNEHGNTVAEALITRAKTDVKKGKDSAEYQAAVKDLERAVKLAEDKYMRMLAEVYLAEPLSTEVGDKAPEIAADDLDGQAFKLSDYKGKVVMLDFWGDW